MAFPDVAVMEHMCRHVQAVKSRSQDGGECLRSASTWIRRLIHVSQSELGRFNGDDFFKDNKMIIKSSVNTRAAWIILPNVSLCPSARRSSPRRGQKPGRQRIRWIHFLGDRIIRTFISPKIYHGTYDVCGELLELIIVGREPKRAASARPNASIR